MFEIHAHVESHATDALLRGLVQAQAFELVAHAAHLHAHAFSWRDFDRIAGVTNTKAGREVVKLDRRQIDHQPFTQVDG